MGIFLHVAESKTKAILKYLCEGVTFRLAVSRVEYCDVQKLVEQVYK